MRLRPGQGKARNRQVPADQDGASRMAELMFDAVDILLDDEHVFIVSRQILILFGL